MELVKIAFKNLNRQKRRSFLLGGAIAFGVLIVTVIDGFSGAFMANVSENFANIAAGHVFVSGQEKSASGKTFEVVRDDALLMQALGKAAIPSKYVTKRSTFSGTLIFEGKRLRQSVQGVDFSVEKFLIDRLVLLKGSFSGMSDPQGLILAESAARRLNAEIGDRITVQLTTYSGQQNVGELVLTAIIPDNGLMSSFSAYANLAYVNRLLNLGPGEYMTLGLYLPSLAGMGRYGDSLYAQVKAVANVADRKKPAASGERQNPMSMIFGSTSTETWTGVRYRVYTLDDILSQVQQIVSVLNTVSTVILLVLFTIIMVGIVNTFRMIMFERIREIGTMRAVGMRREGIRNLFLLEALFLALGGACAGMVGAGAVMGIASLFDFGVASPAAILMKNGHLSFRVPASQALFNLVLIAALTTLAAYFPARGAARMAPAEALRTTK
jgi:putative ABC transport system permease protein